MIRYIVYRLLWAVPTLFGVSLLAFVVTTVLPEPAATESDNAFTLENRRRSHFLDLPLFFNPSPRDARTRTEGAVREIAKGGLDAKVAAETLVDIGGAALPHAIAQMEALDPASRARVAVALAPIGERLNLGDPIDLRDPERAPLFWERFWDDRTLDFTEPSVRRNLGRFLEGGAARWERELLALDTFALPQLMRNLDEPLSESDRDRLVFLAHAMTSHLDLPRDPSSRVRDFHQLRSWWFIHRASFVTYDGAERVAAFVTDTRYSRWLVGALTGRLGLSTRDGESIGSKLAARAPITLALATLALLMGVAIAIPVGVVSAFLRGKTFDTLSAIIGVAMYATPSFALSVFFAPYFDRTTVVGVLVPLLVLALASAATLSRRQRAVMIDILSEDYVRASRARGAPPWRWLVVHALRNAMLPLIATSGTEFAELMGATLIIEECFSIHGVGWETMRALEAHDIGWLVVTVLFTGAVATIGLIASDVLLTALDPARRSEGEIA